MTLDSRLLKDKDDMTSRNVRALMLAVLLFGGAMFAAWVVPGLTWQGVTQVLAQAPQAQADSHTVTPAPIPVPTPGAGSGGFSRLTGLFGIAVILAIAIALSHNRRAIRWRVVAWGLGLQLLFAIFVLRIPLGQQLFRALGAFVTSILNYSYVGSQFVFGELGKPNSSLGVIFAFQLLPAIIFVSALFAIMYYLGIMQVIVRAFALLMSRVMGASGAESLNVAASIFMGQTEAPLTIRPFLPRMTRSELMTVMTSGMAHISGSIMVAYIAFGIEARHLLTAVIMTAPGTIMMAKLFE
ncbi:MAG TPA: Na+ dependent nucleoside transporter N-terminal domain-containing protein, partial [Gemmatimonadales bacterium]|nr:Na+ dependent nucleoside transporter N-terminal domain-containing protein [Gemmatimonadales bacterium]